ncbi:pyridoxal-phosphate dependent enzyme [bacterium]|nr:pyridoxal-phosphate dependent enzyme [bacterium]
MPELAVDYTDILAAAERVRPYIHRTPILTSRRIDEIAGASLFFKAEPLQKTGSFKARGATNGVFSLSGEDAAKGVATHSSGNFAAALAQAAAWRGIPAHVVMPTSAPEAKRLATEGYGATIVQCEPTLEARETTLADVVADTGATFLHPYNDARVIAGQGTAGLELMDVVPDLDTVLVPVGGGGLCSGVAIAVHRGHDASAKPESSHAHDIHVVDDSSQDAHDIHVVDESSQDARASTAGAAGEQVMNPGYLPRLQVSDTSTSRGGNFPIPVYGVEPEIADDAKLSLDTGTLQPSKNALTIADGLRTALGTLTFPILHHHLEDILLVSEDEIRDAMLLIWTRLKLVVEPSGATVLAALLKHRELFAGKRVGLVLSGGNVDLSSIRIV